MKLLWFIPTHGDGRYLGTSYGGRPLDYGYLKQIACAVDNLGFFGALLPTGRSCEDALVTASALERIREYAELGVDSFIFSGYPHLEEAYRVAELLFPLLKADTDLNQTSPQYLSPFGEVAATASLAPRTRHEH